MRVVIVTALACEASPVIRRLALKAGAPAAAFRAKGTGAFRCYGGGDTTLVISGVGKASSAAATAWAGAALPADEAAVLVNFGCGGHGRCQPGEVLLAHEVRDEGSGRRWFPPLAFTAPCGTSRVVTVDRPETRFEDHAVYEMEASGFVETAGRFTTAELVQCLKFVSDNRQAPAAQLDARRIEELAEGALGTLEALLDELRELAAAAELSRRPPPGFDDLLGRWRLTVTQRRQLHRLLERWRALAPELALPPELAAAPSGRQALRRLSRLVEERARGLATPEDGP